MRLVENTSIMSVEQKRFPGKKEQSYEEDKGEAVSYVC